MRRMSQLWLSSLFLFLMGCTSLSAMKSADLRNTSEFPNYDLSAVVDDTCSERLVKSDKRTRDEFIAQWENTTDEELVMLWLWHNGEVRDLSTAATNPCAHQPFGRYGHRCHQQAQWKMFV